MCTSTCLSIDRGDGIAVALIGENGHALPDAEQPDRWDSLLAHRCDNLPLLLRFVNDDEQMCRD
jgi:hypothetical protein